MPDVAGSWLRRAQWQARLFGTIPRRAELLALEADWPCTSFSLRVHRNQAFEFVASVLPPFLAFGGRQVSISYGAYDDSLAFQVEGRAEVELLWVDYERYRGKLDSAALAEWLESRVAALRTITDATILIADSPLLDAEGLALNEAIAGFATRIPGLRVLPLSAIAAELGSAVFDRRAARLTGMTLSDAACLRVARELGLVWLPAAIAPRLKAIVLDLDNTLYAGVLGEDGPAGLVLSPEHLALQERLLALRESGLFLAIASRNEVADVDALFAARDDLPLRQEHFSARAIAFRSKGAGIREIATALRIGIDAMLFVDDNPGEIASVVAELPGIQILHAADPGLACRVLERYPGLHGHPPGRDDARRVADLEAAQERNRLVQSSQSPGDYLRSLGIVLSIGRDDRADVPRLAELSNKTNQFNTAFLRQSEAQVARRLDDPACQTFSIALRDRLSDSGIVAAIFISSEEALLSVDEIVISCRALGREIEQALVAETLRRAVLASGLNRIHFKFKEGPRNDPAREFLEAYAGRPLDPGGVHLEWDALRAEAILARFPISIEEKEPA